MKSLQLRETTSGTVSVAGISAQQLTLPQLLSSVMGTRASVELLPEFGPPGWDSRGGEAIRRGRTRLIGS